MRMKIIAVLLAATVMSVASAQVLYWQVNSSDTSSYDWSYATIYAVNGNTTTQLSSQKLSSSGTSTANNYVNKDYSISSVPAYATLSSGTDYSGYSFYIELATYDSGNQTFTGVARSNTVGYNELSSAIQSAVQFRNDWSSINPMGASGLTYTAIPEPTSGLLLLVGAAVLGLRRKRQQI